MSQCNTGQTQCHENLKKISGEQTKAGTSASMHPGYIDLLPLSCFHWYLILLLAILCPP